MWTPIPPAHFEIWAASDMVLKIPATLSSVPMRKHEAI